MKVEVGSYWIYRALCIYNIMAIEIWKPVIGYEGIYEVSSIGRVKSLPKKVKRKNNSFFYSKEKFLKPGIEKSGYLIVVLSKNKIKKSKRIHQLVAEAFLNHTPCGYKKVIDHVNDVKTDNSVENLQIVSHRFNTCKTQGKYSSQFKGVYWNKNAKKWQAQIHIKGKSIYLGLFDNEIDASEAYEEKLKELSNG